MDQYLWSTCGVEDEAVRTPRTPEEMRWIPAFVRPTSIRRPRGAKLIASTDGMRGDSRQPSI